ncbi:hypothetical protein [Streptomyces gardneri]|uniref:hypothetical protein n=1 Tax=Streptomyces gardneri TaxID=66892 RepID=UPI0035DD9C4B
MTWSMDWAGLVPAAAAVVQIAAVAVQAYWDRRRTASTTQHHDDAGAPCPACAEDSVTVTAGITVQVSVVAPMPHSPSMIVRVGGNGTMVPRAKEHGRW